MNMQQVKKQQSKSQQIIMILSATVLLAGLAGYYLVYSTEQGKEVKHDAATPSAPIKVAENIASTAQAAEATPAGKEEGKKINVSIGDRMIPDAFSVIFSRKSVRKFTNEPVSNEDLTLIVKAGMAAPSAVDKRPWGFVVITDRAVLDELGEKLPYAKMIHQATAAIVVVGDLDRALEGEEGRQYWIQDCSAATQNILLAVEALGLGAVWTAAYPRADRVTAVRETLKLPETVIPLNVIPIGHPDGDFQPKDKWDESRIHWNKW